MRRRRYKRGEMRGEGQRRFDLERPVLWLTTSARLTFVVVLLLLLLLPLLLLQLAVERQRRRLRLAAVDLLDLRGRVVTGGWRTW